METFMREWQALVESKSGERGVFNRQASKNQAKKYKRRDPNYEFGTNPCSEIILRPYQFCNLTEVVIRATDTLADLERKVRIATILGTIQSSLTNFPYLRKVWSKNTEEERLLGVSLTGIMDNPLLHQRTKDWRRPLHIFVELLSILTLNLLTLLVYLIALQLRALNHQEQYHNWWIQPLGYMLAIVPIISVLFVVITKIH